jgi:AAHS family 4-hydroxybenzoate transporter-like MFS transporter
MVELVEIPTAPAMGSAAAPSRRALLVFCLCSLAMIAEGFDTYSVGYVGPALVKEWSLGQTVVGQIYAVGVAASLVGSLTLGALSDLIGRKWLLVAAMVLFGVSTLVGAAAPDVSVLLVTRVVTGLGLGASIPCAMALATEEAVLRFKATVPVLMSACIGIGVIVASLAAAAVMPRFGWRGLLWVGGVLPLLVAAPMIWRLPNTKRAVGAGGGRALSFEPLKPLLRPDMVLLTVIVIVGLVATYTVTFFFGFWLPTLVGSVSKDIRTVGLASALIKTFSLFGSLTLGRLMDRFGAPKVLPAAFVAAFLVLVTAIGTHHTLTALVLSLGVASFFLDGAFSGIIGFSAMVFPASVRGAGIGATVGIGRLIGGTLGPIFGGLLLSQGLSVKAICAAFASPLLVAALMVAVAARVSAKGSAR